jgi:hypothetical protein
MEMNAMKWPTTVGLAAGTLMLGWTISFAQDLVPRLRPSTTLESRIVRLELELRQTQDLLFDFSQDNSALLTRIRDLEDDMVEVKRTLRAAPR